MSHTPKHNNPYYDAASEKRRRVRHGFVALGVTLLAGGLVAGAEPWALPSWLVSLR